MQKTNLEKIGRKITLTLLAGQSLFSASSIISFTVSSIIVVELAGANKGWAGVPATLSLVGAAMVAYPMGRTMDRFGRRPGLALGYLFGIVGTLVAGWAVINQSLLQFLLGSLLFGLSRGTNDLGRYASADANPASQRARAISLVVLGGTFGSIAGPIIIDWVSNLASQIGLPVLSGPWFAASILLAFSLLLIILFLRPDPQIIGKQWAALEPTLSVDQEQEKGRSYREIFRDPNTKLATGALIFGQLAMVTVMTITPLHMHGHHHTLAAISWVIMAHTLGMFGLSFLTGWLVDKLGQAWIILLGGIILVMACLLAPLWDNVFFLAVALFLLGLGWNFCFVAGSALLATVLKSNEKGRIQGLTDTLVNITAGIGSMGSGLVFAAFGFWTMSWLSILIAVQPVVLVILLHFFKGKTALGESAASS